MQSGLRFRAVPKTVSIVTSRLQLFSLDRFSLLTLLPAWLLKPFSVCKRCGRVWHIPNICLTVCHCKIMRWKWPSNSVLFAFCFGIISNLTSKMCNDGTKSSQDASSALKGLFAKAIIMIYLSLSVHEANIFAHFLFRVWGCNYDLWISILRGWEVFPLVGVLITPINQPIPLSIVSSFTWWCRKREWRRKEKALAS